MNELVLNGVGETSAITRQAISANEDSKRQCHGCHIASPSPHHPARRPANGDSVEIGDSASLRYFFDIQTPQRGDHRRGISLQEITTLTRLGVRTMTLRIVPAAR